MPIENNPDICANIMRPMSLMTFSTIISQRRNLMTLSSSNLLFPSLYLPPLTQQCLLSLSTPILWQCHVNVLSFSGLSSLVWSFALLTHQRLFVVESFMPINLLQSVWKLNVTPTMGGRKSGLEKYFFHSYYIRKLTCEV